MVALGQPAPKGGGRYKVGSPYQINGRWYRPKEEPSYDRVGIASWYGDLFHGRHTANGEIFDMAALTAAHPTLPMPIHVRVTNLENGRSIVVRVNDRGPYAHDRIIDMSARSAKLLGFQRQGTAKVRVTYLKKAPINGDDRYERQVLASQPWAQVASANSKRRGSPIAADPITVASITPETGETPGLPVRKPTRRRAQVRESTIAQSAVDKLYFVQAAAFRRRDHANNARSKFTHMGSATVFPAEVGGQLWYRVRIGPFERQSDALSVRDQLQDQGHKSARLISN